MRKLDIYDVKKKSKEAITVHIRPASSTPTHLRMPRLRRYKGNEKRRVYFSHLKQRKHKIRRSKGIIGISYIPERKKNGFEKDKELGKGAKKREKT